jgi:TonB family protein
MPGASTPGASTLGAATPGASTIESPLLVQARAALAANRLTEPAGDNALELYLRAQARDPSDPKARAGLADVHERLLAKAENSLLEERLDEAAIAIEAARKAGVESGRIAFLTAQLAKSRQRTLAAQPAAHSREIKPEPDRVTQETQKKAAAPAKIEADEASLAAAPESASTESVSARHDLDTAVSGQQFLANVAAAGDLKPIKSAKPEYPRKAELAKIEGWVELDFTVAESGEVKDVAVHATSAPGVFESAAISALSQWRYKPIVRDGKPVAQRARIRMRFAL